MTLASALPVVNACLNFAAFVILIAGWIAVRRKRIQSHRRLMWSAFAVSALFLVGYLTRMALTGAHTFPDVGPVRTFYLVLLISHSILAAVNVPLILRALYLATKGRYPEHRRVVKFAWPIWVYVSLTGVVVYVMLYHVAPAMTS